MRLGERIIITKDGTTLGLVPTGETPAPQTACQELEACCIKQTNADLRRSCEEFVKNGLEIGCTNFKGTVCR